jgi:hypothetical protein
MWKGAEELIVLMFQKHWVKMDTKKDKRNQSRSPVSEKISENEQQENLAKSNPHGQKESRTCHI